MATCVRRQTVSAYVQTRCPACGHFLSVTHGNESEVTCRSCGAVWETE